MHFSHQTGASLQTFHKCLKQAGFLGEFADDLLTKTTYSTDNSIYEICPDCLLFPKTKEDLNTIVEMANNRQFSHFSLTMRGGGTGTNAQSLNRSIVIDCSRHLNKIIEFDESKLQVTVEPGVVLSQLNDYLDNYDCFFPPNISTASRATLGGMVATDASGKGSACYGKTSNYVLKAKTLLANGEMYEFAHQPLNAIRKDSLDEKVQKILHSRKNEIAELLPKHKRGLTGYNLIQTLQDKRLAMPYLLAGSEGTLAIIYELTLQVRRKPSQRALCILHYANFDKALRAASELMQLQPLAIETMDEYVLAKAQTCIHWQAVVPYLSLATIKPTCCLMLEIVADDEQQLTQQIQAVEDFIEQSNSCLGMKHTCIAEKINQLFQIRSLAVGLLASKSGYTKPVAFVEDTAVPVEKLANYIYEFRQVLESYQLNYGMYGHADVGCLHVRPELNLLNPQHRQWVDEISQKVNQLVLKYGGIFWGEHAKGVRGEFNQDYFPEPLTPILVSLKKLFDPHNRLNPGKLISANDEQLYSIAETPMRGNFDQVINFEQHGNFAKAAECNGNGVCFDWNPDTTICPSYKGSRDRNLSPQGRSAILRKWLRMRSNNEQDEVFDLGIYQNLQQCLSCQACKTLCPVKVDIPSMKNDFLAYFYETHRRSFSNILICYLDSLLDYASHIPKLSNLSMKLLSKVFRSIGLVDLPALPKQSIKKLIGQRLCNHSSIIHNSQSITAKLKELPNPIQKRDKYLLVPDAFSYYYQPQKLIAILKLAEYFGVSLELLQYLPDGKAGLVKGNLALFKRQALAQTKILKKYTQASFQLVGVETSITQLYQRDYQERLSKTIPIVELATFMYQCTSLKNEQRPKKNLEIALYSHCTEQALQSENGYYWQQVFKYFGIQLKIEKVGCCGMAGSFGYELNNQQLSKKIYQLSWQDKLSNLSNPEKQVVATGFSCVNQVKRLSQIDLMHPIELLVKYIN